MLPSMPIELQNESHKRFIEKCEVNNKKQEAIEALQKLYQTDPVLVTAQHFTWITLAMIKNPKQDPMPLANASIALWSLFNQDERIIESCHFAVGHAGDHAVAVARALKYLVQVDEIMGFTMNAVFNAENQNFLVKAGPDAEQEAKRLAVEHLVRYITITQHNPRFDDENRSILQKTEVNVGYIAHRIMAIRHSIQKWSSLPSVILFLLSIVAATFLGASLLIAFCCSIVVAFLGYQYASMVVKFRARKMRERLLDPAWPNTYTKANDQAIFNQGQDAAKEGLGAWQPYLQSYLRMNANEKPWYDGYGTQLGKNAQVRIEADVALRKQRM